jgi:hypothetical protein
MNELTEAQVARVVAEVTRQAQLREVEQRQVLDRQQVVQILEELNLPVDLLEPAMRELERREAEAEVQARYDDALRESRKRKIWIAASVLALVLVVVLIAGAVIQRRRQTFSNIAAQDQGRLTRVQDDGGKLGAISRDGSDIYYRVTLERVPISENLSLKCNWIDSGGRIVKQNSWQTRTTDKAVWATQCHNTFGSSASPGKWTVEMLLDERVISRTDFQVE